MGHRILSPYLNPYRRRPRRPTAVRFAHRNQGGTCGPLRPESGMRYHSTTKRLDSSSHPRAGEPAIGRAGEGMQRCYSGRPARCSASPSSAFLSWSAAATLANLDRGEKGQGGDTPLARGRARPQCRHRDSIGALRPTCGGHNAVLRPIGEDKRRGRRHGRLGRCGGEVREPREPSDVNHGPAVSQRGRLALQLLECPVARPAIALDRG